MKIVLFLRALATFIEKIATFENKRLTKLEVTRKQSAIDASQAAMGRAIEAHDNAVRKAGEDGTVRKISPGWTTVTLS